MFRIIVFLCCAFPFSVFGQYPPAAGLEGSTAIPADSTIFVAWANTCMVNRGWQDISDPPLGLVDFGTEEAAIGPAGENGAVSLGDGGTAILTFDPPITNGPDWDFAVFENGFAFGNDQVYLELATVEVSSNGVDFVIFPASSLTDTTDQIDGFGGLEATLLNNLAGKYRALFGAPFDLAELVGHNQLDINKITHIRLTDVVGSLSEEWATRDAMGRKINDPFPTPFPSSGFDLDAVGVIHQLNATNLSTISELDFTVSPNPVRRGESIKVSFPEFFQNGNLYLYDLHGSLLLESPIQTTSTDLPTQSLPKGIYFLSIIDENRAIFGTKIMIQ